MLKTWKNIQHFCYCILFCCNNNLPFDMSIFFNQISYSLDICSCTSQSRWCCNQKTFFWFGMASKTWLLFGGYISFHLVQLEIFGPLEASLNHPQQSHASFPSNDPIHEQQAVSNMKCLKIRKWKILSFSFYA